MNSDDELEAMVREVIERHIADPYRKAALEWLDRRITTCRAVQSLGLLDDDDDL